MIENDRQLEVSKKWLERFRAGLECLEMFGAGEMGSVERILWAVQTTAFRSQIEELETDITNYESMQAAGGHA